MTLHPIPLNFLIYEENFILFFISASSMAVAKDICRTLLTISP